MNMAHFIVGKPHINKCPFYRNSFSNFQTRESKKNEKNENFFLLHKFIWMDPQIFNHNFLKTHSNILIIPLKNKKRCKKASFSLILGSLAFTFSRECFENNHKILWILIFFQSSSKWHLKKQLLSLTYVFTTL